MSWISDAIESSANTLSGWMTTAGDVQAVNTDKANLNDQKAINQENKYVLSQGYDQAANAYQDYANLAPESLATLQSAIYGRPVEYLSSDYKQLTGADVQGMGLDQNKIWYYDKTGKVTDSPTVSTANFQLTETPSYKNTIDTGTRSLNRNYAARGLSGSGQAATGIANLESSTAASEYNNALSRLSGLADYGEYGTTGIANASLGTAQNMTNSNNSYANTINSVYNQLSEDRASTYSNAAAWNSTVGTNVGNAVEGIVGTMNGSSSTGSSGSGAFNFGSSGSSGSSASSLSSLFGNSGSTSTSTKNYSLYGN